MAFTLIRSGSHPYIAEAGSDDARPADADRVAASLRADFECWSRWGLGILGFVLASAGSFVAVGLTETVLMRGGVPVGVDLVVIVCASVVALAGIVLLAMLWSTRRLRTRPDRRSDATRLGPLRRRPAVGTDPLGVRAPLILDRESFT
ncbi:hypothetical protein GCM10027416_23180 [Okibacterium endophyticum]